MSLRADFSPTGPTSFCVPGSTIQFTFLSFGTRLLGERDSQLSLGFGNLQVGFWKHVSLHQQGIGSALLTICNALLALSTAEITKCRGKNDRSRAMATIDYMKNSHPSPCFINGSWSRSSWGARSAYSSKSRMYENENWKQLSRDVTN